VTELDMHVTESARARIAEVLSAREAGSVVALMYGGSETYGPDGAVKQRTPYHWQFQVYPKSQVQALERDHSARGMPLLYELGEITLCIPQVQLLDQLRGRTLDYEAGAVVVK
jgi:hypothetical protein